MKSDDVFWLIVSVGSPGAIKFVQSCIIIIKLVPAPHISNTIKCNYFILSLYHCFVLERGDDPNQVNNEHEITFQSGRIL